MRPWCVETVAETTSYKVLTDGKDYLSGNFKLICIMRKVEKDMLLCLKVIHSLPTSC